jgi:uncharacterized membrane protein
MTETTDHMVDGYVKRLNRELGDLPRDRRREVVDEIREHIGEARAELPAETEAELRNILDRLGEPAEIAADARERFGVAGRRRSGLDIVALVMLLVGGVILPVVGWFVGLVLLWMSRAWNVRDKLIGTLVLPGGLVIPFGVIVLSSGTSACVTTQRPVGQGATLTQTCSGGLSTSAEVLWIVLLVVLAVVPIATTIYLARQRNNAAPA